MKSMWCLIVALALAACTDPRKLVLVIDTNAAIPCDIDRIRIRASATKETLVERSLQGETLPLRITLLDETPSGSFELEVAGLKDNDEVVHASGSLKFGGSEITQPVMLDVTKCGLDASCPLVDPMSAGAASATATTRFQCGSSVKRYMASPAPTDLFTDVCSVFGANTGKVLTDGSRGPVRLDQLSSLLPGFKFQFYGQPIHQIWVHRHGFVSFDRVSPDPNGDLVPGALDRDIRHVGPPPPRRSVMASWDSLAMASGGVCYDLEGPPGSQVLRLEWRHACFSDTSCGPDDLNFMITLEENSKRVVVIYGPMITADPSRAQGANATVGIVDDATGCPATECVLETGLCKDGVTPCGYSQVFSKMAQAPLRSMQFRPVEEGK